MFPSEFVSGEKKITNLSNLMNPRISQAIVHALKVGLHILWSLLLLGLGVYIKYHETIPAQYTTYFVHFGIPAALVNMGWSGLAKFVKSQVPDPVDYEVEPDVKS